MTVLYRISKDSDITQLTEENRELMLNGVNPWNCTRFKKQGVKSFNDTNKIIFDIYLSKSDKNLLDSFGSVP